MNVLPTPKSSKPPSPVMAAKLHSAVRSSTNNSAYAPVSWRDANLPYKNSIATVCFEGSIWDKIAATGAAGFDYIEIMTPDLEEATPQQILQHCKTHNLSISILQPFRDLEGYTDKTQFESKLADFDKFLQKCSQLQTDLVLLCANCDENSVDQTKLIVSQLRQAAKLAAKYGVRVAYENLSWAAHQSKLDKLVDLVEKVDRDNFGICVDLFHVNIHDSSLDSLMKLKDKIFFAQFCDSPPLTKDIDILEHARNYRVFPFQGSYDNLLPLMKLLDDLDYKGPLSLEVFNRAYKERAGQCCAVAEDALRSLVYLQAEYSDIYKNTHLLPPSEVSGLEIPDNCAGWHDVKLFFSTDKDLADFRHRVRFLGFPELIHSGVVGSAPSQTGMMNVTSRLSFNRHILVIRIALGLMLQEDELNKSNEFNLPSQQVFGNGHVKFVLSLNGGSG